MTQEKALISIIGKPSQYKQTSYKFQGNQGTYYLSSQMLDQEINPNYRILIAGMSLLDDVKNFNCKDYETCSNLVKDYLKENSNVDHNVGPFARTASKIIVTPNVFGNKYTQSKPGLDLYFNYVYKQVLDYLLSLDNVSEVHLDVTHGINYMPVLGKDAITLALSVYSILKNKEVNFSVYNSDPYVKDAVLNINVIERYTLDVRRSISNIVSPFFNQNIENLISPSKVIDGGQCWYKPKLIMRVATALASGNFIYLATKDIRDALECVENSISTINLKMSNNLIEYYPSHKRQLVNVHALCKVANDVFYRGNGIALKDLEDLAKKYSLNETIEILIRNEINLIKRVEGSIPEDPKLLDIIMGGDGLKKCNANKRNLFAHGGFERKVTYLWKSNDEIYVSYRDCLDNVENQLR
ncbi:CRISPR-associated CARF protein Csx1 [Acidianus sp. RZ1]|uniref:CRISPR-associated CARF protein Csx1 n=1 Tax=Acidianus sp. RZ1 TaxID=1540082 RepID=UPI0014929BF3|nr:CRISPR-associated CARF protein Csx1 [Acidianus sp. RZ1]NON61642.1 TIGR01897 family CRISPR-associated protein [Acidianus sp. RZ1]